MPKIAIFILLGILLLLIIVFALSGGFAPAKPEVKTAAEEFMAYEEVTGDYSQSPQIMQKIYQDLLAQGIETTAGAGFYYDNPSNTPKNELRSEVGTLITQEQANQIAQLGLPYKTRVLAQQEYLTVELPYPNQLAVFIQMMKAYPALSKYSQDNNLVVDTPVIEIYDMANKVIIYRKLIELN